MKQTHACNVHTFTGDLCFAFFRFVIGSKVQQIDIKHTRGLQALLVKDPLLGCY